MPSRRGVVALSALGLQAALVVASLAVPGLGAPVWHHHASLAFTLVLVVLAGRWFAASRLFLALGVGGATLLAVASGFVILYAKPWLKAELLVDWAKFWHVLWSWWALAFTLGHVWINRVPLLRFWQRMHAHLGATLVHYSVLIMAAVALVITWSPTGRAWFTEAGYLPLTAYTFLVVVAPAYGGWALAVVQNRGAAGGGFTSSWTSGRVQAIADVGLVPATLLANLSGFPILYFKPYIHGTGLKYVAKYWHTWPSIVMALLVFIHTVQSWPAIVSHWRRFGAALGDAPSPPHARGARETRALATAPQPPPTPRPAPR